MSPSFASAIVLGLFVLTAILAKVIWEIYRQNRKETPLPTSKEATLSFSKDSAEAPDPWEAAIAGRIIGRPISGKGRALPHLVPREEDLEFPLRPSSRNGERPPSRGADDSPSSRDRPNSRESARSATSYTQAPMRGRMRSPPFPGRAGSLDGLQSDPFQGEELLSPGSPPSPLWADGPNFRERPVSRGEAERTIPAGPQPLWPSKPPPPEDVFRVSMAWKTWPVVGKTSVSSGSKVAWDVPEPSKPPVRLLHSMRGGGVDAKFFVEKEGSPGKHSVHSEDHSFSTARQQRPPIPPVASSSPSNVAPGVSMAGTAATHPSSSWHRFWRPRNTGAALSPTGAKDCTSDRGPHPFSMWFWPNSKPMEPPPQPPKPPPSADSLIAAMTQQLQETHGQPLEERKRLFRELQRQLHPDKNVECEEAAKLAFQELMQQRASYLRG